MCHSYACAPHHLRLPCVHNLLVGVGPAQLVESSSLLRAATQHPGSSSPVFLLRRSSAGVIWMGMVSLSSSSLGCLATSTIMALSHLMAWWSFHVCSVTADFSRVPFRQASWCSLSLVSNLLLVSPMQILPQLRWIRYTTLAFFTIGRGSFTLVSTERNDCPALKITFIPNFLHTHLMSSLMSAVYGSTTKGGAASLWWQVLGAFFTVRRPSVAERMEALG